MLFYITEINNSCCQEKDKWRLVPEPRFNFLSVKKKKNFNAHEKHVLCTVKAEPIHNFMSLVSDTWWGCN